MANAISGTSVTADETLRRILAGLAQLADGRMKLVGGIYEMASGRVRFL